MMVTILNYMHFIAASGLCVLLALGCGEASERLQTAGEDQHPRLSVGKHDGQQDIWRAEVDGVGIWIDVRWRPVVEGHRLGWSISLGADEPISLRRAGFRDQETSWHREDDSTYRVELTGDQFLRALSEEVPFFEFVVDSSGAVYSGVFEVGARFENFQGTSRAYVEPEIEAVFLGRRLFLRGHIACEEGFSVDGVYRDDGAEPVMGRRQGYIWSMDWTPHAFLRAVEEQSARTTWEVRDSDDTFSKKSASVVLRVASLALREGRLRDGASSLECDREVLACLDLLEPANHDSSSCGNARQVAACLPSSPTPVLGGRRRFAKDLTVEVDAYYRLFSEEIESRGGRTLEEARALIDMTRVRSVDDLEEGSFARYPTSYYDIYRHPDVIFENSAMIWYGVYDAGGGLVDLFAVNAPI
jgi:hypothetical protein